MWFTICQFLPRLASTAMLYDLQILHSFSTQWMICSHKIFLNCFRPYQLSRLDKISWWSVMICQRSIAKRGMCMWCIIILMLIIIWMFPKGWEMYQLHPRENHLQGHAKILPNSWINKYVGYLNDLSCTPTNHYYTRYCNIHHGMWLYLVLLARP